MSNFLISEAAALLAVSDDTIRRWVAAGRLTAISGESGPQQIRGAELARLAQELAEAHEQAEIGSVSGASARNRMSGLVTRVVKDKVMAQVEMQAGPYRIVSLLSRESADELGLEPGSLALASIKATNVVIEVPEHRSRAPRRASGRVEDDR